MYIYTCQANIIDSPAYYLLGFIHSFIHTEHLYSASSRELLRGAPDSSAAKKSRLALVSWAFARIGVHRPSLRFPYLVFSIRSDLPLDFNRVSSLRPTYRHPFGRPFTYSLFSFQASDWLWYPMLWSQRRNIGAHGAENSIQISALAGVEPRTLASSGRRCYHFRMRCYFVSLSESVFALNMENYNLLQHNKLAL